LVMVEKYLLLENLLLKPGIKNTKFRLMGGVYKIYQTCSMPLNELRLVKNVSYSSCSASIKKCGV
jgi:hypothetical protein